jgi:cytochrome c553
MSIRVAIPSLLALGAIAAWSCSPRRTVSSDPAPRVSPAATPAAVATPLAAAEPAPKDAVFEAKVRPILATSCAPCHNPGGKMYERLPFDDAKTVRAHADGVRKRLKGDNLQALEAWLAGS